ncbi:MAG: TPM domain-containing protein [Ferruginibacter sp.]
MFGFSKPKPFFTVEENLKIVSAIKSCETTTSGEIRVYIEAKNPYVDPLERAREIFFKLMMEKTEQRNAVILYIAHKHKEMALFGDEGIHEKCGQDFWNEEVSHMIKSFSRDDLVAGIEKCVIEVSAALHLHFPYDAGVDKNELPDEIVFGRL